LCGSSVVVVVIQVDMCYHLSSRFILTLPPFFFFKMVHKYAIKELNAAAVRRGAFSNSGTKDAGVDKDWDFTTNKYRYGVEKNVKPLAKSRFDDLLSPLGDESAEISRAQSSRR
jgi:hypothetical protein